MLLDEEPAALIANCIANFSVQPDKACLARTHAALASLRTHRSSTLATQRTRLATLHRTLAGLGAAHQLATQSHSAASHAHDMHRLDADKFRIAKEAAELEIDADRLAKELAHARRLVDEGGSTTTENGVDVAAAAAAAAALPGGQAGEDEMLLKLKVYRMLGIDVERDAETGVYQRAVVRNRSKGDVSVVTIDAKFSRYFYANYLWGVL